MNNWHALSVLALSSRFDGPRAEAVSSRMGGELSVLALSSRFDGPITNALAYIVHISFQYSLCRVVLMVLVRDEEGRPIGCSFQYSLCRVVLMVQI